MYESNEKLKINQRTSDGVQGLETRWEWEESSRPFRSLLDEEIGGNLKI